MSFATILDGLSWLCLVGGGIFGLVGAAGMLRLPDVFSRMHAAGIIDTLAAGLILLGLGLQVESWLIGVKLLLIFVSICITGPTSTHALARAALNGGVTPLLAGEQDPIKVAAAPQPETGGERPSKA